MVSQVHYKHDELEKRLHAYSFKCRGYDVLFKQYTKQTLPQGIKVLKITRTVAQAFWELSKDVIKQKF